MPRARKAKWTPEAEQRAAEMWNAQQPTELIVRTMESEFGLVIKAQAVQDLQKRKGAGLGMVEGTDRRRAARPSRPSTNAKKKASFGARLVAAAKQARELATVDDDPVEGTDFMDLKAGHCRYPLTKSLPHKFCSAKAVTGSWCAEHLAIIKGKAKK